MGRRAKIITRKGDGLVMNTIHNLQPGDLANQDPSGPGLTPAQEYRLIQSLRSGENSGYKLLFALHGKKLLHGISAIVKRHDVAEDLLQETFIKIHLHISSYSEEKGGLLKWLFMVARNTTLDYLRSTQRKRKIQTLDLESLWGSVELQCYMLLNTDVIGIRAMLNGLNFGQREIIRLVYFEGYSHSEAATYLSIPLGTVKSRVRKAMVLLREVFKETNYVLGSSR